MTFLMLAASLAVPLLGTIMLLDSLIDPQPVRCAAPAILGRCCSAKYNRLAWFLE